MPDDFAVLAVVELDRRVGQDLDLHTARIARPFWEGKGVAQGDRHDRKTDESQPRRRLSLQAQQN
jgi:hypothetical protein